MKDKKIIIVHGYTASPSDNWFQWLKESLESLGATVNIPLMPDSHSPDPKKWQQHLIDAEIKIDKNTIFIGHSLGCITVLKFLTEQAPKGATIGGYILVSGFDHSLESLPELHAHVQEPLDYDKLIEISDKRISVISSNDWVVNPQASKDLANALQTQILIVNDAGHFLDREGYTEFPALRELIKSTFL
ncbi:serine hydrolase family protein [Morganella morganii]